MAESAIDLLQYAARRRAPTGGRSRTSGRRAGEARRDRLSEDRRTSRGIRTAVWNMRLDLLASGDLSDAIALAAHRILCGTTLELRFQVSGDRRDLDETSDVAVLRIVQEAISNAVKHAAACTVRVGLTYDERELTVAVHDDGRGVVVGDLHCRDGAHWGILDMKERAALAGASLEVHSAPGRGTEVLLRVPLPRRPWTLAVHAAIAGRAGSPALVAAS